MYGWAALWGLMPAAAKAGGTNKIKATTGPIRFTIRLKFIYSICQTLYSWPGRGITPDLSDGGEPQAGSTCALAGLQHTAGASLEDGQQNCPDQEGFCRQAVERPEQEPRRRVR